MLDGDKLKLRIAKENKDTTIDFDTVYDINIEPISRRPELRGNNLDIIYIITIRTFDKDITFGILDLLDDLQLITSLLICLIHRYAAIN